MKFALSSVLLLAAFGAVAAQDTTTSSAAPSDSSSTAAPAPSSTMMSSMMSSSPSSSAAGGDATSMPVATCTLVSGDPDAQPFGCVEGASTSTPPYDSASLQSFQIDRYSAGKEGVEIEQVATQMAKSVTQLYPTLTVSFSDIVEQYLTALEASTVNFVPDGAVGSFQMPAGLSSLALVAVAAVAGGAFVL